MKSMTTTNVSVDGVMQGLGGPEEDRSGGFDRGGWAIALLDAEAGDYLNEVYGGAAAFLFGRRTYEIFAGYWGSVHRSEHEPDRRRAEQPAQVRGVDQPCRPAVGGHECPDRRRRRGRR